MSLAKIVSASTTTSCNKLGIARLGDRVVGGPCNFEGRIVTASANTFVDNIGVARLNDIVVGRCRGCKNKPGSGRIITASTDTNVNSRGVARLGDLVQILCGQASGGGSES